MAPWLAVLAMVELSAPALELAPAEAEVALFSAAPSRGLAATAGARPRLAPPCSGDVCQPRVAVPGFEPRFDTRGKRTELVLLALDRAHVEPLATIVWAIAATGLRLDYTPPQFDHALASGHGGWGHVQLLLRWRIDASNAPVWPVRRR